MGPVFDEDGTELVPTGSRDALDRADSIIVVENREN